MDCVDFAILAEDAYMDGNQASIREVRRYGWRRVWQFSNAKTGFACSLYQHGSSGQFILAYRGSDDFGDLMTDLAIGVRWATRQFQQAMNAHVTAKRKAGGGANLVGVCGHSLGGALAKFVAAKNGLLAYSFNGPGVSGMGGVDRANDQGDIRNINAVNDIVSKYGANLGRTKTVTVSSMNWVPDWMELGVSSLGGVLGVGNYLLSQHSITNLRRKLQSMRPNRRPFA